jgi:hypothetical protein
MIYIDDACMVFMQFFRAKMGEKNYMEKKQMFEHHLRWKQCPLNMNMLDIVINLLDRI